MFKLDLVCRKQAVSNSRPACREAFLKVVVLLVFTRVSGLCCSAYVPRKFRRPYVCHMRVYCVKTAEPVIEILSLSDRPVILFFITKVCCVNLTALPLTGLRNTSG